MFEEIDWIYILWAVKLIILAIVVNIFYKYFISPWWQVRKYRNQGGVGHYAFGADYLIKNAEFADSKGDWFFWYKSLLKRNPGIKFFVRNLGGRPILVLTDKLLVREFIERGDQYKKDPATVKLFESLTKGSVLFSEGERARNKKGILMGCLSKINHQKLVSGIAQTIEDNFNSWSQIEHLNQMPVIEAFTMMTGEIWGKLFFGPSFEKYVYKKYPIALHVIEWTRMVMAIGYSFTNYILGPGFIKLKLFSDHRELLNKRSEISGICKRLMKEALEKKVEDTLILEILRHAGKEKDHAYTPDEIISEFLNLFTMAADTTATVLGLTVYYLDKNQGCLKKLIAEIKKMGKKVSELTKEDLDSMDYLTAVLKETLRLASPYSAMLNRVATKDHYLGEVKITKNTLLTVYPGVLHSLETVFDQPDEFNPSRWLNKQIDLSKIANSYIPFSFGPRACIGKDLAYLEAKMILIAFLQKFEFKIADDYNLKLNLKFYYGPMQLLKCKLNPKDSNNKEKETKNYVHREKENDDAEDVESGKQSDSDVEIVDDDLEKDKETLKSVDKKNQ